MLLGRVNGDCINFFNTDNTDNSDNTEGIERRVDI